MGLLMFPLDVADLREERVALVLIPTCRSSDLTLEILHWLDRIEMMKGGPRMLPRTRVMS